MSRHGSASAKLTAASTLESEPGVSAPVAAVSPSPSPTRVFPSWAMLRWPKSETSDFGGGEGRGEGVTGLSIDPNPLTPTLSPPGRGSAHAQAARAVAIASVMVAGIAAAWAQPTTPPPAQPPAKVTIGFVEIEGDARHEPLRAYERLIL